MTITRDGKEYTLTPAEMFLAWQEMHKNNVMQDIDDAIEDQEISFDSFAEHGFDSPESFRSVFVGEVFDMVEERLDYGYSPSGAVYDSVADIANDYDIM